MGVEPVAPRLTVANCVVIGSLNPAILQPNWVIEQDILPKGEATIELAAQMAQPSLPVALRFTLRGLAWVPQLNRLEVQAVSEDADAGQFVSRVLAKLVHTPVRAIGHNFHFDPGDAGESLFTVTDCAPMRRFLPGGQSLGHDVVFRFGLENGALNLTVSSNTSRVTEVQFNFHREMKDAGSASKAASGWANDRHQALQLMSQLQELKR